MTDSYKHPLQEHDIFMNEQKFPICVGESHHQIYLIPHHVYAAEERRHQQFLADLDSGRLHKRIRFMETVDNLLSYFWPHSNN